MTRSMNALDWQEDQRFYKTVFAVGTERKWSNGKLMRKEADGSWSEIPGYVASQEVKQDLTIVASKVQGMIQAPHVNVTVSTLGGADKASLMITMSLDKKETWQNGIFQNSRNAHFRLDSDGTLECYQKRSDLKPFKFIKTKVKSVDDAVAKINTWIDKVYKAIGRPLVVDNSIAAIKEKLKGVEKNIKEYEAAVKEEPNSKSPGVLERREKYKETLEDLYEVAAELELEINATEKEQERNTDHDYR